MIKALCQQYLAALNAASLEKVLSLFAADAIVSSPLYGEMPVRRFYQDLFADTAQSQTKLLNIFDSSDNKAVVALHFNYTWTLQSGKIVDFECVDVFELAQDGTRFTKLTIIYDTHLIRDTHAHSQQLSVNG